MTARDPGLQPERTTLAWQRTALPAAVAAALLLRGGLVAAAPLEVLAGAVLAIVAVTMTAASAGRTSGPRRVLPVFSSVAVVAAGALTAAHLLG